MANTTGFAFGHVIHGGLAGYRFEGKGFGMALFASVRLRMECVTEGGRRNPFQVERNILRLESLVTAITVGRYRKSALSVVA